MNEQLQDLLDSVQNAACQVSQAAADAACGVGKKAETLLSVAKLRIRAATLEGQVEECLEEIGGMIYATHTGDPTDSETLLAKLQEIDGLKAQTAALRAEISRLQEEPVCPICGAPAREADVFCRECGGKL